MKDLKEFQASDKSVRDIAAMFALKGWTWGQRDGEQVDPFVPKASDIARTLNMLYEGARAAGREGNGGNGGTGRLFVSYIDEGYGDELSYGIEWTRLPGGGVDE